MHAGPCLDSKMKVISQRIFELEASKRIFLFILKYILNRKSKEIIIWIYKEFISLLLLLLNIDLELKSQIVQQLIINQAGYG